MARFNYKTASKEILGDLYTPVSAYLRLRDSSTESILMESSDYHSGRNARSYIALEPVAQVSIGHGVGLCQYPDGSQFQHEINSEYRSDSIIGELMRAFSFSGTDA
ncbi:MAG: anthranilate synthase component I family protein, partial [Bacteroidaceae bacterium]|nr:anthranilate synthase component I family protein [Bacteroidaceae bacterium]